MSFEDSNHIFTITIQPVERDVIQISQWSVLSPHHTISPLAGVEPARETTKPDILISGFVSIHLESTHEDVDFQTSYWGLFFQTPIFLTPFIWYGINNIA